MKFDFGNALGIHDDALRLRSRQAEIVAGNLTNADTPNYKARTIDFKAALEQSEFDLELQTTQQGHLGGAMSRDVPRHELLYRVPLQGSIDGNTVDAHAEKQRFMDNALRYNAELTFLNSRVNGLLSAIRGE